MSRRETSRSKSSHQKYERGNANEIPLGTRKRRSDRGERNDEEKLLPNLSNSRTHPPRATGTDTIGSSLRQIRNQVTPVAPSTQQKRGGPVERASPWNGDEQSPPKRPSIKDRLGLPPIRGKGDGFRDSNVHNFNNQYSGRGQRGGVSSPPFHHTRGGAAPGISGPSIRGYRGRGGFRGRGGNGYWNKGPHTMEGAFPDRNVGMGDAYPAPTTHLTDEMQHKVRPRSVRRAAAQLQSLFDTSLTFSSPANASGPHGMECGIVSPAVQEALGKVINRRRYATKDCEECMICSNALFQVCHPHISTIQMIRTQQQQLMYEQEKQMVQDRNLSIIETNNQIWCPICRQQHDRSEFGSILVNSRSGAIMDDEDPESALAPPGEDMKPCLSSLLGKPLRRKLVMSSGTLHNLWRTNTYTNTAKFHIDFDCIIGGQIHDVHASFLYQYATTKEPMNILIACGVDNIMSGDSSWSIIFQLNSFVRSILQHSEDNRHEVANRILICPLVYAPKYCDNRLAPEENMLQKVIEVNRWIQKFNKENTGLQIKLDCQGVIQVPNGLCGVQHDYGKWNESNWQKKLYLTQDAKEIVSKELIEVFETLDHQSYMLGKYRGSRLSEDQNNLEQPAGGENMIEPNKDIFENRSIAKGQSEGVESIKPPGVEEEDESDEDLSYLL